MDNNHHLYTDMDDLDLCRDYCTCGTPDPYNDGHTENCAMALPISILREVESLVERESNNGLHTLSLFRV